MTTKDTRALALRAVIDAGGNPATPAGLEQCRVLADWLETGEDLTNGPRRRVQEGTDTRLRAALDDLSAIDGYVYESEEDRDEDYANAAGELVTAARALLNGLS